MPASSTAEVVTRSLPPRKVHAVTMDGEADFLT
jgi:hypothetical protein